MVVMGVACAVTGFALVLGHTGGKFSVVSQVCMCVCVYVWVCVGVCVWVCECVCVWGVSMCVVCECV